MKWNLFLVKDTKQFRWKCELPNGWTAIVICEGGEYVESGALAYRYSIAADCNHCTATNPGFSAFLEDAKLAALSLAFSQHACRGAEEDCGGLREMNLTQLDRDLLAGR